MGEEAPGALGGITGVGDTTGGVVGSGTGGDATGSTGGSAGTGGVVATGGGVEGGDDGSGGGEDGSGGSDPQPDGGSSGGQEGSGGEPGPANTGGADQPSTDPALALFGLDNPDRNRVVAGDVCGRLATLQCAGEALCCESVSWSFEDCKSQAERSCAEAAYLDIMTADPMTGFEQTAAEQKLARFEQLALECDPSIGQWAASPTGLQGMMLGTLAEGAACQPSTASLLSMGAAAAAPYLAACLNPVEVMCLPQLFGGWSCTERGGVGAECFTDLNCLDGLYCPQDDYLDPEFGSSCRTRLALGSNCAAGNECASFACKDGICVESTSQSAYCLQ